jgi:hypothetical protein
VPDSSQITTAEAPISIRESSPNPASATDRAEIAATVSTAMPTMFQASVVYSRAKPRRSRPARVVSSAMVTVRVSQHGTLRRPRPRLGIMPPGDLVHWLPGGAATGVSSRGAGRPSGVQAAPSTLMISPMTGNQISMKRYTFVSEPAVIS